MTTLTPEELAACRKEFEEFSLGKLSLVTHPADPAMYSSELTNFAFTVWQSARSKSAKEIASLKDSLSVAQTHVACLLIVESRLQDKRDALKAQLDCNIDICKQVQAERDRLKVQVEGMKNVRLNIRHRDCHKAADAFWKYWKENGDTHKKGYYESTWGAINSALKVVGVIAIAQEKSK